ncbi:uncharacterized protein LOC106077613 isoform X2 [Biomphalaria glabrata]|uniref:Uncharacterized protein LOC106077613 isoform X2 n=1 Tax=Biomphalaria glabrata TaxID=6526 RepID=A0A9W3BC94_BIOGL|nr:uncharacterized protein LOC106077613 isoform X2 [Biomphalaria glabrata]
MAHTIMLSLVTGLIVFSVFIKKFVLVWCLEFSVSLGKALKKQWVQRLMQDEPCSYFFNYRSRNIFGLTMQPLSNCSIPDLLNHYYNSKMALNICRHKTPFKSFKDITLRDYAYKFGYCYTADEIKAVAQLTVKIEVKMLSSKRPHHDYDFFPNPNNENCLCVMCREPALPKIPRSGSGVINLFQYKDGCCYNFCEQKYNSFGSNDKTCPCDKCRSVEKPSSLWWDLCVTTEKTLVYDEEEAHEASCILFYDTEDSPVVVLNKLAISYLASETICRRCLTLAQWLVI